MIILVNRFLSRRGFSMFVPDCGYCEVKNGTLYCTHSDRLQFPGGRYCFLVNVAKDLLVAPGVVCGCSLVDADVT